MNLMSHLGKRKTPKTRCQETFFCCSNEATVYKAMFRFAQQLPKFGRRSHLKFFHLARSQGVEKKHPMRPCDEVRKSGVTWRSAVQCIRKFPWKPKAQTKLAISNSEDVEHYRIFALNSLKTHNVKLWICFPLEPAFLRSYFTMDRLVVVFCQFSLCSVVKQLFWSSKKNRSIRASTPPMMSRA